MSIVLPSRSGSRRKACGSRDVERHFADRLDARAVDAFPLDPALVAGGKSAVVEREVQRARQAAAVGAVCGKKRRQSEAPPPEHRRPRPRCRLIRRQAPENCAPMASIGMSGNAQFVELAADQSDRAALRAAP